MKSRPRGADSAVKHRPTKASPHRSGAIRASARAVPRSDIGIWKSDGCAIVELETRSPREECAPSTRIWLTRYGPDRAPTESCWRGYLRIFSGPHPQVDPTVHLVLAHAHPAVPDQFKQGQEEP